MKSKEALDFIREVELNQHGIKEWTVERARMFQKQNLNEQVEIEYELLFIAFLDYLRELYGCRVTIPTAKKILNNAYIRARDNRRALANIKPFEYKSNPFEFLLKNDFRIDYVSFAKVATPDLINYVKKEMPQNSKLSIRMKEVADKKCSNKRGFNYNYLVKSIAGFLSFWDNNSSKEELDYIYGEMLCNDEDADEENKMTNKLDLEKNCNDEMKKEAISRIKELIKNFNLNPNVLKYFEEGKIYYSYLTAGGFMGSIDTIDYDSRYSKFVKEFEEKTGYMVYHAIETGNSLSILFVSNPNNENLDDEQQNSEWKYERVSKDGVLYCFVKNFEVSELSEAGDIVISSYGDSGALVRIG